MIHNIERIIMIHQNINLEYETYRENYIKKYGFSKYMYKPEKYLELNALNLNALNLNASYDKIRDDLFIQNKEYMPHSFSKWDMKVYQDIMDNDIKRLHYDNDMDNLKIVHAPDIELPFDARKDKASIRIQRAWRECINNPSYKVCRKRLLSEFKNCL